MPTAHIDVFDTTVQKTHDWLNELGGVLGTGNKRLLYRALARRCTHSVTGLLSTKWRSSAPSFRCW